MVGYDYGDGETHIEQCKRLGILKNDAKLVRRNPSRIPIILDKLKEIWEHDSDMRLGQLISVLSHKFDCPLFYLEDNELMDGLGIKLENYCI